jgi:hypothetical protein
MDKIEFADYDMYYRFGVFDKCNGMPPTMERDESSLGACAYFDGYDSNEVKLCHKKQGIVNVVMEADAPKPEQERHKVFVYNTGDDLIECVFDEGGQIIGAWSPNDCYWCNYFNDFLSKLGIDVSYDYRPEIYDRPARLHAMELWGLSAEDVGLDDE